jgi:endoglucanase
MRKRIYLLSVLFITTVCFYSCSKPDVADSIRINSLGYLPNGFKSAVVIADSCDIFYIKSNKSNRKVFNGKLQGPYYQEDVDQKVWKLDFSELTKSGDYYIDIPGIGTSTSFSIRENIYDFALKTVFRGFYLLRCGTEVSGVYKGDTFYHPQCHMDDGWLTYTEFGDKPKDGTGGWHDAGDYGKYTVNAGFTIANLLFAWDHFQGIKRLSFELPATTSKMPEYLTEIKWETDYLLKMVYPDNSGRVFHKLTGTYFRGFIQPEADTSERYFSEWSSNATACFTATMAMVSRYFKPYDSNYATKCLDAALLSYQFLKENPEYKKWEQPEFNTGAYQAHDGDNRLWAAAELWETTGSAEYLNDFEVRANKYSNKIDLEWDWGNPKNLAMFTYILSKRTGKNDTLTSQVIDQVISVADSIVNNTQNDVYGRSYNKYHWGCNGAIARLSLNLRIAFMLNKDEKYIEAGQKIIDHIFGLNYYGRSYVTGLGINPPMLPHDRRSASDSISAPWPGYLIGGGHTATDWVDDEKSYSHNEIAINWQAPLVYLLSWFVNEENSLKY